ncbi:MAG: hypothetical protein GSR79_08130 [Desulfurococcales archaeon]|nr:hypothetical protein [Desulfurococcales archaeon]
MYELAINYDQIERIAEILSKIVKNQSIDPFTNPDYYPPPGTDFEALTMYFLVMVSMDHRLSRPNKPYEMEINGKKYHGADLLYKLGMNMFESNPYFFTASHLSHITEGEVEKWFAPTGVVKPADLKMRTLLLRDIGRKLRELFDRSAYNIVEYSKGYLKNRGTGFIELLKSFIAYQDPVEKKAFLLAKFLERRRVLQIIDSWNKEVPVDNHLTRLAIRWGLIDLDQELLEKISYGLPFSEKEDILLRYYVQIAFRLVSQKAGIDPFVLDDFLWNFGRTTCRRDNPACIQTDICPLMDYCRAFSNRLYMVGEHSYYETWYY